MPKLPYMKFYPRDWLSDINLSRCSLAAKGLWIDMVCLAWECKPRGFLQDDDGQPLTVEAISRMTGNLPGEVSGALAELRKAGVISEAKDGVIFSRRIVRDEERRESETRRKAVQRSKTRPPPDVPPRVPGDVPPDVPGHTRGQRPEVPPKPPDGVLDRSGGIPVWNEGELRSVLREHPWSVGSAKELGAVYGALERISTGPDPPDNEVDWLIERTQLYAKSELGRSHPMRALRWYTEEHYRDDPSHWQNRAHERDNDPPRVRDTTQRIGVEAAQRRIDEQQQRLAKRRQASAVEPGSGDELAG